MNGEGPAKDTFKDTWDAGGEDESDAGPDLASIAFRGAADQGPCLYLGLGGQRCDRRAVEGGYCARHRPGAVGLPKSTLSKRTIAAIVAVGGLLWPYIADVVREIVRWMHAH